MKKTLLLVLSITFISITETICQNPTTAQKALKSITLNVLQSQLGFLSSDWMEGRRAGEKGAAISSDYIASMLELYGVKPGGDVIKSINLTTNSSPSEKSWFQNFIIIRRVAGDIPELKLTSTEGGAIKSMSFTYNVDFMVRPGSSSKITAPVMFVGYGFRNEKLKVDELAGTDIKGKFLLKVQGVPDFAASKLSSAELFSTSREFDEYALQNGAAGILEIASEASIGSPGRKDFENMSPNEYISAPADASSRYYIPGNEPLNNIPKFTISHGMALRILEGTGISLDEYIKKAGSGLPYTFRPIPGKILSARLSVNETPVRVRNVIGIIEGNNPNQVIVLGAHYDHMGINNGYIWNGADDNGSGTVAVMTIAKSIMETGVKPDKTIIFALWTAEEEGLLGSKYFVKNFHSQIDNIKLNVNFDMISRYINDDQPRKVVMTYTDKYPSFRSLTESNLQKYGIDLDVDYQPSANPPGGSDHRSFVEAGLPVMRFKPGHREEYHKPNDEISTIDWDIMEKIVKISFANVWELANSEW